MQKQPARYDEVEARFMRLEDLDDLCDYFFRSPPGFLTAMGINMAAMQKEEEFRAGHENGIRQAAAENKHPRCVTVLFRGKRVGMHSLTHMQGESAIMHAHFYHTEARGRGIGTVSYVKAMHLFLHDFGLKEIVFKTPVHNLAPMRIKEKLGLVPEGEEELNWPLLLPGVRAKIYRVRAHDLARIKARLGFPG
jgi:RimJ/RimL family protein N-acetyltransferase